VGAALIGGLIGRCEALGIRLLVAVIGDSGDAPSMNLHARFGFARAGLVPAIGWKHGRWVDRVPMARRPGGGAATPPREGGDRASRDAAAALGYALPPGVRWPLLARLVWGLVFTVMNIATQQLATAKAVCAPSSPRGRWWGCWRVRRWRLGEVEHIAAEAVEVLVQARTRAGQGLGGDRGGAPAGHAAIDRRHAERSADPKPFVWTASPSGILA